MDLLSDILAVMKLRGTLYFRTAFTAPWGIEVPPYENVGISGYETQDHGLEKALDNKLLELAKPALDI